MRDTTQETATEAHTADPMAGKNITLDEMAVATKDQTADAPHSPESHPSG